MDCPACGFDNIAGDETCEKCGQDLTELTRPKAKSYVDKGLHKEPARSIQVRNPVVVTPERKVVDVIASLVAHNQGCALVVDAERKVVGVFSERDLLMKVAGGPPEMLNSPVREFMTPNPVTIAADAPIAYALHQMDIGGYRHVPLVEDGKAAGMISVRDIVTYIGNRVLAGLEKE